MIIEESDFRLTPVSDNSPFWDLELLYTIKSRTGLKKQEFKNSGYGLTLNSAIKKIVSFRIQNKHSDEAITMKQYLDEYKNETKKLEELLN